MLNEILFTISIYKENSKHPTTILSYVFRQMGIEKNQYEKLNIEEMYAIEI